MILEKQKESQVFTEGEEKESIAMSLDLDSAQILMQMLSKNLYSDEIGSTVRELASNALDSHRRAGVDKPIIVSLKMNDQYSYEFSVEDFGVGLDADDVKNIISKYGKSLAREEEGSLGMMGLGFKAPLAYTSAFYFLCRKNGIERKYMMYEGEDGNTIDLLHEQPTNEVSGVKVMIPLKGGDKYSFISKINEQLAYFENVYFDCDNYISNDFLIHRSEHFQYSDLSSTGELHLCLDNVYYPLDFGKLGINRIDVPVGLRFSLKDGIFPTPNRESLRYTPDVKKIILNKIALLANDFIDEYNSQFKETEDVSVIFSYYGTKDRVITIDNKIINIVTLLPFASNGIKTPTLKGVKYLDLKDVCENKHHLVSEYYEKYTYTRGKIHENNKSISIKDIDDVHFFVFTDKVSGNKREYMKSILGGDRYHFVKKVRPFKLGKKHTFINFDTYYKILNLGSYPKHLWRKVIQEFQQIQAVYTSKFKDFDAIVIPKAWLDNRKMKRTSGNAKSGRRVKLTGQIFGKICVDLERYVSGKSSKLVPVTLDLETLHEYKGITVYTSYDDADKLDPLYSISRKSKTRFVAFSDREMKVIKDLNIHNFISYDKFMEGKNMPFKRLVTAYLINALILEQDQVFGKKHHLKPISADLHTKLVELHRYRDSNFNSANAVIYKTMLEVAETHKLFDYSVYTIYLEIKQLLEKLKWINVILKQSEGNGGSGYSYNSLEFKTNETYQLLVDMFKYYKHRIDVDNYDKVEPKPIERLDIVEDAEEEEVIIEEESLELEVA